LSIIPALRRLRQEDLKFKAILGYITNYTARQSLSLTKTKRNKQKNGHSG
jgi:hypothetical protein